MTERPILFSGTMVRALLAGSKTQTRRLYKVRRHPDFGCEMAASELVREEQHVIDRTCPYGQPGDHLWVREAFACTDTHEPEYDGSVDFRADGKCYAVSGNRLVDVPSLLDPFKGPWRPGIHMPRWASRILLEITSVRVQRLKECSQTDAIAEGAIHIRSQAWDREHFPEWRYLFDEAVAAGTKPPTGPSPLQAYEALWESINGAGSWGANPWVWVVECKRVTP